MAILCIILKDNLRPNHPAPHTAARPGDVVSVYEDDVVPGKKTVADPNFALIRLPGINAARLKFLTDPVVVDIRNPREIPTAYRKRHFIMGELSREQLDKATQTELVYSDTGDVPADRIRDHIRRKDNLETLRQEGRVI